LSTLRFGVRAKAIKNKAKINAELSPTELKLLLKKAQSQVTTFESYVSTLEGEVQLWRQGESVPKEKWTSPISDGGVSGLRSESKTPRPATPSRLQDAGRDSPSRPDSRIAERASTPSLILEKDEREDFLRRENEFQDQIAEKETIIAAAEKNLRDAREELAYLKEHDTRTGKDNEKLNGEVNELKMHLEKISFESKEAQITMDSLKEANSELTAELDEVKQNLLDIKMSAKETSAVLDEKEKKKAERMAKMMAGFDLGADVFSDNERSIRNIISQVDALHETSSSGEAIAPDSLDEIKAQLLETQGIVRQAELSLTNRADTTTIKRSEKLQERLDMVERDYEELLERNLGEGDVDEIRGRLEKAYSSKRDIQIELVEDLKEDMARKMEENSQLRSTTENLQRRLKDGAGQVNGTVGALSNGKTVQQQIAEFDVMKKSLMRDLQNRCERVRLITSVMSLTY
jgi:kinesin family protein 5